MSSILPEGEDIRRAIKWVSSCLEDDPKQPIGKLVEQAVFKFDLSPKDSDFLINFFHNRKA